MTKRRKIDEVDSLALQLQTNKDEFNGSMNILASELKDLLSLKSDLIEKIRNISRNTHRSVFEFLVVKQEIRGSQAIQRFS